MSYLAGGIPTGYLVAKRFMGIDIREHGSGNPGTANVYRVAGAIPGLITLAVDALKGFLPVLLAQRLYPSDLGIQLLTGAAAIVGHDWTVFLGFKGGKGVATTAGVLAALCPKTLVGIVVIFAAGMLATGHISVGSMAAAASAPVFNLLLGGPTPLFWFSSAAAALILYKHVPNMRRIWGRKELQIREKN